MDVWIPLNGGSGPDRKRPKSSESGWQMPSYEGIKFLQPRDWYGLRLDEWIVVDCDSDEAVADWIALVGAEAADTFVRKTPKGTHFFYRRTLKNLRVQARVPFLEKTDLKLGTGHYVVFYGDGYYDLKGTPGTALEFDPSWLPAEAERPAIDDWSEMPEGIGDNAMAAFAGTFRRWGMDEHTILQCLIDINAQTMTEKPMPSSSLKRIARSISKKDPEAPHTVMCPKCAAEVEIR
jgi:hypothetical protein